MKGYLTLAVLIASLLIAGCTTTQPVQQTIVTTEPAVTVTSELHPGDITYSDDNARWPIYTNTYDRYRIYYPNDWIAAPIDSPYIEPKTDKYGTIRQIRKQVYIYPTQGGKYLTSENGVIVVTGYTLSGPDTNYTPEQINDEYSRLFAGEIQNSNTVTNVRADSNEYLINRNPAKHLTFDSVNGATTYDNYQIVHNYSFYNLQWAGNRTYAPTASRIMRTFATF